MMHLAKQIEFMENAEKRAEGYFQRWLQNPEFKAALHRHDRECGKVK